ncbi:hypothetical protein [Photobacterium kishitanii]|uniref:hypothetical protein n=1 Tax=Photobacterium kishitanii TaxID=318456 RepID=UPI00043534F7|nr:hypothetical protein [Photobacterium kishitanii]CEO38586.1 hypothetical protein PPBDW_I20602 [Photobacterium kishitanii]
MEMILRKTTVLSIDEFTKLDVMDFSTLRLQHPTKPNTGRPIDLGAVAYSDRQRTSTISSKDGINPTLVNKASYRKERLFCISNFATEIANKKPDGVKTILKEILPIFDWMDMNNHEDFLISPQHFREAYLSYTNHLIERLKAKIKPIKPRVAKDKQWMCRKLIGIAFPDNVNSIIAGIITLKSTVERPEPILDSYLGEYWDINLEIFTKFSNQCYSTSNLSPIRIKTHAVDIYYSPRRAKTNIHLLENSPPNPRDSHRINLAMRAQSAFIQLFRILTKCNNAELRKLGYSELFTKERDKLSKEFYEVKFRANNRPIVLRIEKNGYKIFKQFLTLRSWILDNQSCQFLFFSLGQNHAEIPQQISRQQTDIHHNFLKKAKFLPSSSSALKDQQIRSANTHFLRKAGHSSKHVADNNNHTVAVSEAIYSTPPIEQQISELDNFWNACENAINTIVETRTKQDQMNTIISGSCSTNNDIPISIIDEPPITPDCNTPQGCLFCIYYVCHADEEDLRKLLSLLFVIQMIMDKAIDFEFADQTYSLLIVRIEYILDKVSTISTFHNKLVDQLKIEILNDGVLTEFWDQRLDYYETMGLINK